MSDIDTEKIFEELNKLREENEQLKKELKSRTDAYEIIAELAISLGERLKIASPENRGRKKK